MRRFFHPIALVLLGSLVFVGCQTSTARKNTGSEKTSKASDLKPFDLETGMLTVAYAPDYPPYEYEDKNGDPAGIAVNVITEIARRLDMELRFRQLQRDKIMDALQDGTVDVTAWMPYSPARSREFALSVGWGETTSIVYVRKTSKFDTVSDVVPKVMAASKGSLEQDALLRKGVTQLIAAENIDEALMKTVTGAADGAGCNREVARIVMEQHIGWKTSLRELAPPLAVTPLTMASREGNETLVYHISRVLLEMKRDGSLEQLTAISGAASKTSG